MILYYVICYYENLCNILVSHHKYHRLLWIFWLAFFSDNFCFLIVHERFSKFCILKNTQIIAGMLAIKKKENKLVAKKVYPQSSVVFRCSIYML